MISNTKYRDLIERRMVFYKRTDKFHFTKANTPILLSFMSLVDELSQDLGINPEQAHENVYAQKGLNWVLTRVIYKNYQPGEMPELKKGASMILNALSSTRDWVAQFL